MNRFVLGAVEFEAFGGYPERFLNEAESAGVSISNARRKGESLFGICRAADYRTLRPAARKSGVRLRVKRRWGLPFLMRPFRLRGGLAVGCAAAIVVLQLLSSRVWVITVNGNETVSDEAVLQVLEPLGVHIGAAFDKADVAALRLEALRQLPTLGWLTVNQSGSVLEVLVTERQPVSPIEDTAPADIVAAADGVVCRLVVTSGQAAVNEGDEVKKGDVLIYGMLESDVGPMLRRAGGTVTAKTEEAVQIRVPYTEEITRETVAAVRPTAVFFGWRVPLYTSGGERGREEEERRWLTVRGRELPLGLTLTRVWCDETVTVTRTEEEATAEAYRRLAEEEKQFADMTVENRAVTEEKNSGGTVLTAVYTLVREIGEIRPINF